MKRIVCFVLIGLLLARAVSAETQPLEEEVWQQFLEWLPAAPAAPTVGALLEQFRATRVAAGASTVEALREIQVVRRAMRERTDGWRVMFNRIYASPERGFSVQPNALLAAAVEGRTPGHALDVGMGQGRNTVFLAMKGWHATGFDVSEQGIDEARRNAARAGVTINAVVASDEEFDYGIDRWDLVVFMYEPFPITSPAYVERLLRSMKPGARIVIESFAADANAPHRPPVAIDPVQLRAAFKEFRILHFEDVVARPDWGTSDARLVRMVAEVNQGFRRPSLRTVDEW